jgi:hypothetical protein
MPELERYRQCRCGNRMELASLDEYSWYQCQAPSCGARLSAAEAAAEDDEITEETAPSYRLKGEYESEEPSTSGLTLEQIARGLSTRLDCPPLETATRIMKRKGHRCVLADHETADGSIPDPCPACERNEATVKEIAAMGVAVNLPMSRKPDWYQGYDSWAARADGKFYVEDAPASMREPPKSDEEPKP